MPKKTFSISGALQEGWELTKVNIGFLVIYQMILFFLMWLFHDTEKGWNFSPIHIIGWLIITLGKMGFYNSALLFTKGVGSNFSQFYSNWRLLFSWIIASVLFAMMFVMGLILLIIPGLLVWATFGFYPFFILDKKLGPIEALKESAKVTKTIRWHILALFLACTGIDLLGLLFFGVGLLITMPVTLIAMTVVYRILTGQEKTSIQPDDIIL